MKRQILKLTTEPTDEPILGTSAEADAWGRRKFIIFQKLPQFFTHHSLVLWRRSPFQNWLLSWSSRLLNQGVRYFPFLFECWVSEFFFCKKSGNSKPVKCGRALRNLRREQMTSQNCSDHSSHFRLQSNGGRRVVYSDSLFPGVFWPFARSFLYRLVSVLLNYMICQSIGTFVCNLLVNNLFHAFFPGNWRSCGLIKHHGVLYYLYLFSCLGVPFFYLIMQLKRCINGQDDKWFVFCALPLLSTATSA